VAAALLMGLTLSACNGPSETSQGDFVAVSEEEFGAGYTHIVERYVEPVSIGELAVDGMKRVGQIDPKLTLTREGDKLRLSEQNGPSAEFDAPRDDDPGRWAITTSAVLEKARQLSPPVRDAGLETIYDAVFGGALKDLDPFSRYASAAVAREQRAQRDGFGGIGITIAKEGKDIQVVSVMPGGPSAAVGVKPKDVLVAIDGAPLAEMALPDVIDRLRGAIGSEVRLTVAAATDQAPRDLTLKRALIVPPTVSFERRGDIAYIKLTGFNLHTTEGLDAALRQALAEMGPALRGAVLDMRDNPGGLLDQAVTVSELFLKHGRILSTVGRHPDSNQTFDANGRDVLHGLPIAILINHGTASAAEVVAAALQDQGRAIVVGTASYGKGTVQTVHRLPNSGEIIITWSRIHAPSGYNLNEVGVIPNVCTSKVALEGDEAVAEVVNTVKSGRLETTAARASLHANGQPNKLETRLLRASCPTRGGEGAVDVEVARKLIEDGNLFAKALHPPASEVARRQ
jgi:carboxyl-terminal processing protease